MKFFSDLLVRKTEGSDFLYYTTSDSVKSDKKIHSHILKQGMSDALIDMSISRLRARAGVSLEDAKLLLG